MQLKDLAEEYRRFGAVKTFQDLILRALHRFIGARVLKGVKIETADPEFLRCDKPYRGQFLSEALLMDLTRGRPEYEMSERFLREAFDKGDECYGFLDGPVLAAYGWYSNNPTAIDAPGMMLHFDPRYIYMYKGFTQIKYRGQRLHAIAMTRALEAYLARGYKGLVSYVEWNNFGSLKSCYRIGYQNFGNVYLARIFGKYLAHADRGCATYSFRLEYTPETVAPADSQAARLSARTD